MSDRQPRFAVDVSGGQGPVVGDYATVFQVFTSAAASLASHIRVGDFAGTIEDRARGFIGRDFVFQALDDIMGAGDFPAGYLVLQGEPGIGKTAVLAHLIKTRGYVHHLNIATLGIGSAQAFLANVCAQLIVRYRLDHPVLPDAATRDGGFLSRVLAEAAATPAHRPVVVVVDALDEADDDAAGTNTLYLPPVLPPGVFIVVSTRPGGDANLHVEQRRDIYLNEDTPENLADIRTYIQTFLADHQAEMAARVTDLERFTQTLVQRSEGNFMYLVHVLRDIQRGVLDPEDEESLPQGLRSYYRRHWDRMRHRDEDFFQRYQEPVVCLLATAREAVTLKQIAEWTGQYWARAGWDAARLNTNLVSQVVRVWHEFLNESRSNGARVYRIYHASFQDFLREEVGLTASHAAISATALAKIPHFLT